MADVKISELPAASTPLAGTEQIPLVQDATTKQITVSNLLTSANLGTPSAINLANATNVPMDEASGVLAVANGGSGTATPALVAGTNVTISGSWPNQTINSTYSGAVTSVTGTAPVVSSGGTTPAISMAAATGSVNGYLTSTDWTTFNNKLTSGGPLGTPSSGTATNLTGLPLSTGVTGLLPVANGGTGTATPNLVAGSNVTISGTWPNQTIAAAGAAQVYPGAGIANSTGSAWGTSYSTTGSGTVVALATSPTFVTPALGVPASGDFSSGTFTWPTFNQNTTGTAAGLSATLAVASGGTGQTSYTDGQLLIGNSTGNTLTKATLTAGANITITNSAGGITIAAAGGGGSGTVTSVSGTGTVNGLTLTGTVTTSGSLTLGGTLDLSSPPAIGTTTAAAGAFTTLSASSTVTLSGGTANGVTYLNGSKVLTSGSALTFNGTNTLAVNASAANLNLGISTNYGSVTASGTNPASIYLNGGSRTGFESHLQYFGSNHVFFNETGGSEIMRLLNTGNVGIGTSSPGTKLNVVGGNAWSGNFYEIGRFVNSGSKGVALGYDNTTYTGTIGAYTDGTASNLSFWTYPGSGNLQERMRLDASGNLSVAVGNIFTASTSGIFFAGAGSFTNGIYGVGTNNVAIAAGGSERARIDSSGNLLVGKTAISNVDKGATIAPSGEMQVTLTNAGGGNQCIFLNREDADGTAILFRRGNGTVGSISVSTTATAYNTSSDYRLKNSVAPMTGALAKVAQLKPVTYKWNADGSDGEGFIAHELAEVVPQCVTGEKDAVDEEGNPKYQGIDTSFLVATLTAALQELNAKFDAYVASHP